MSIAIPCDLSVRREGETVALTLTMRLTDHAASELAVALLAGAVETFDARVRAGLVPNAFLKAMKPDGGTAE